MKKFALLIEQNIRDKKKIWYQSEIEKNLKISPVKFELKKLNDDEYVVVFNFPFKFKLIYGADDGFCEFFKFQKYIQANAMLAQNINYTSENIKEMVKSFSLIEW